MRIRIKFVQHFLDSINGKADERRENAAADLRRREAEAHAMAARAMRERDLEMQKRLIAEQALQRAEAEFRRTQAEIQAQRERDSEVQRRQAAEQAQQAAQAEMQRMQAATEQAQRELDAEIQRRQTAEQAQQRAEEKVIQAREDDNEIEGLAHEYETLGKSLTDHFLQQEFGLVQEQGTNPDLLNSRVSVTLESINLPTLSKKQTLLLTSLASSRQLYRDHFFIGVLARSNSVARKLRKAKQYELEDKLQDHIEQFTSIRILPAREQVRLLSSPGFLILTAEEENSFPAADPVLRENVASTLQTVPAPVEQKRETVLKEPDWVEISHGEAKEATPPAKNPWNAGFLLTKSLVNLSKLFSSNPEVAGIQNVPSKPQPSFIPANHIN